MLALAVRGDILLFFACIRTFVMFCLTHHPV